MQRLLAVSVVLLASLAGMAADQAPEEKTGLKVGEKAPEFTLEDQTGKKRALKDLLEKGPVALVFYRSASW